MEKWEGIRKRTSEKGDEGQERMEAESRCTSFLPLNEEGYGFFFQFEDFFSKLTIFET